MKALTSFGAFISRGEVDGLIHISQLADRRVQHPDEVLSVGETVAAGVLNVDVERQRVSLLLRAAPVADSAPAD